MRKAQTLFLRPPLFCAPLVHRSWAVLWFLPCITRWHARFFRSCSLECSAPLSAPT